MQVKKVFYLVAAVCIGAAFTAGNASSEPVLVYSQDWSHGLGGWSSIGGFRMPSRIFVGRPNIPVVYRFGGGCGMGLDARQIPFTRMKVSALVYMLGSNRNGFSVNVRTAGGTLIYKYSMGGGNHVDANCQPPNDHIRTTSLRYALRTPYEFYSYWFPGTGRFAVGLKNLITGQEARDGLYSCRSGAIPGMITFDQEGGQGPALLGRVEVWLGQ